MVKHVKLINNYNIILVRKELEEFINNYKYKIISIHYSNNFMDSSQIFYSALIIYENNPYLD